MAYKPTWIANSFLYAAMEEKRNDTDHLKIQKLVYCLHGWNLATRGEPVVGELYEAWPHGPVLSSLYHEFKHFGRNPINDYAGDIDPKSGEKKALMIARTDTGFYDVFNRVWNRYKDYSGIQLSMLTHASDTPWSNARDRGEDYISDEDIREHFLDLVRRASAASEASS